MKCNYENLQLCSSVQFSRSVMSNSLQPHELQPTRLLCSWNYPSKNTGVGCHFLLQGIYLTQGLNLSLLWLPALAGGFFTTEPPGKSYFTSVFSLPEDQLFKSFDQVISPNYCISLGILSLFNFPSLFIKKAPGLLSDISLGLLLFFLGGWRIGIVVSTLTEIMETLRNPILFFPYAWPLGNKRALKC